MGRQHYAVIYYDTDTEQFHLDTWTDATGREEGDVWDDEAEEWRYPDNEAFAGEEDADITIWDTLRKWVAKMPTKILKSDQEKNEEPDLLY